MKPMGILVLDENGRIARRIGREGKGPGEFERISSLGFIGDTLWVNDLSLLRISYFALDGTLIRTAPLQVEDKADRGRQRTGVLGILADHSLFASASLPQTTFRGMATGGSLVVRLSPPGVNGAPVSILDSIAYLDQSGDNVFVQFPSGGMTTQHPWPRGDRVVAASDGSRLVILTAARGSYTVTARDPSGQAYKVTINTKPVPLDDAALDKWTSDVLKRWAKRQVPAGGMDLNGTLRKALGDVRFLPPISDIVLATDRSVWVRREGIRVDLASPDDSVRWEVLDVNGRTAGSVFLPAMMRVLGVRRDVIWAIKYDKDEEGWLLAQYVLQRR
jgi:hypothetical protein